MGTNYYLETDVCARCGRGDDRLHIGKSSGGWCFSLHVDPVQGINSLDDWLVRFENPTTRIVDEYGDEVTSAEMLRIITGRNGNPDEWSGPPPGYLNWAAFHECNHSEPGPRGLLRHRIGRFCVGHGDGTYDLIPGEFS